MYDESMTPQEQANYPDWFVRCYGPQLANACERMRAESARASRWTGRDYARAAWGWGVLIAGQAAVAYIVFQLVEHLKSC